MSYFLDNLSSPFMREYLQKDYYALVFEEQAAAVIPYYKTIELTADNDPNQFFSWINNQQNKYANFYQRFLRQNPQYIIIFENAGDAFPIEMYDKIKHRFIPLNDTVALINNAMNEDPIFRPSLNLGA